MYMIYISGSMKSAMFLPSMTCDKGNRNTLKVLCSY